MAIQVLENEIINQIAAGEVIENPSAVVKELVENSIDAGATEIEIDIENFGLKKIQITDNGCGISKDDLRKAPLRHATSKIKSFNDLYNINTMGFRGEALASIFSVAKTKISSKHNNETYEITNKDNEPKESSCKSSTTVLVEDLFYNTPARRKYLKSNNIELKQILDIVNRFEVYYENISISLKHNGKSVLNKPILKSKEENIIYTLGKELKNNLMGVDSELKGIKLKGFIANPSNITYSFKKNQYIYVNGRYVKSKLISDAIYEGFTTNLMTNRHPAFILFIEIDPEIIDVNVHPTKIEIKFENELEIYEHVRKTVENTFETTETFKPFEQDMELPIPINELKRKIDRKPTTKPKDYFTTETQSSFTLKDSQVKFETKEKEEPDLTEKMEEYEPIQPGPLHDTLEKYKILGQLNKTYIVVETNNELLLVDQHVAEEKYYYEEFKKENKNVKRKSQQLLKAEKISLTNSEKLMYEENKELLHQIGFETEEFGSNEILVRTVPINIRSGIVHAHNIRDMLYGILINKKIKTVEEEEYAKIASMACRISVMAGDELTQPQMKKMIENLRYLKQPFNCPHGRPTFLNYPYKELEKKFKRIV